MKRITHIYSLTPEWQDQFVNQLEGNIADNKVITFPEKIANGFSYFTQVTPEISTVFYNLTPNLPLQLTRLQSENDIYIFHFDLSDNSNTLQINNIKHGTGANNKFDLAIIDNNTQSSFKPSVKNRTYVLRILINKSLFNTYSIRSHADAYKVQHHDETFYHCGNIDSNSALLLESIKEKSIYDSSFDSELKGITLKLLGNFFGKADNNEIRKKEIKKSEYETISKAKDYLLNNINNPFPSIVFLANLAGMSQSKFKILFQKCYNSTPNSFFVQKKMEYAYTLLQSGNYNKLLEIVYELSYSKTGYFTSKYTEIYGHSPADDFIKKTTNS